MITPEKHFEVLIPFYNTMDQHSDLYSIALSIFLTIGGLLLFLILFLRFGLIALRPIPSPKGNLLFGNFFQVDREKSPHLVLSKWAKELGEVYQFRLLRRKVLVLNSWNTIHEAAIRRKSDYSGTHDIWSNIFNSSAENQMNKRKKGFISRDLTEHLCYGQDKIFNIANEVFQSSFASNIEFIIREFKNKCGSHVDPWPLLNELSAKIFMKMVCGENTDEFTCKGLLPLLNNQVLHDETNEWFQLTSLIRDGFPCLSTLDSARNPFIRTIHLKIMSAAKNDENSFVSRLQREFFSNGQPCEDVLSLLTHFMNTGTQILSTTLYAQILLLASYPVIQKKVQTEIDQMITDDILDDLELPFTKATILEMFRLTTPQPLGSSVSTNRKTTMQGYFIPKDTPVVYNLWHVHHDWDNPWQYQPERFLKQKGKPSAVDDEARKRLLPFDIGSRSLLTQALLERQILLILSRVMRDFTLLPVDDNWGGHQDPRQFSLSRTLTPPPYKIRIKERST